MASYAELKKRYSEGPSAAEKFREEYGGPIVAKNEEPEESKPTAIDRAGKAMEDLVAGIIPKAKTNAGGKPKHDVAAYNEAKAKEGYAKAQKIAADDKAVYDAGVAEIDALDEEDRRNLEKYVADRSSTQIANMFLGPQFDSYNLNPIVQKYGIGKVRQMAETYERMQNEQLAQDVAEGTAQALEGKSGIGHNVASIGANAAGGIVSTIGRAQELMNRTGQYQTLQEHTAGDALNVYAGTVREETAKKIEGDEYDEEGNLVKEGSALRKGLSIGYQGAMSAADSIARAALGGGGAGTLALAATGSFSQTVGEASKQGASPTQAIILGVGTAAIEAATEKVPLDNLLKAAKGGVKGVEAIAGNALRQAAIEAGEEEISLFANLLWEAAVLREKSSYKQRIGEAIANGATYEEAKAQADKEVWQEALNTAAVSASAGIFSGATSATYGSLFGSNEQGDVQTEQAAEAAPEASVQPQQEQTIQEQTQPDVAQAVVQELTQAQQAEAEAQEAQEQAQEAIAQGVAEEYGPMMPQEEPKSQLQQDIDNATAAALAEQGIGEQAAQTETEQQEIATAEDTPAPEMAVAEQIVENIANDVPDKKEIAQPKLEDAQPVYDEISAGDEGSHTEQQREVDTRIQEIDAEISEKESANVKIRNDAQKLKDEFIRKHRIDFMKLPNSKDFFEALEFARKDIKGTRNETTTIAKNIDNNTQGNQKVISAALLQIARFPEKYGSEPLSRDQFAKYYRDSRIGALVSTPLGDGKSIILAHGEDRSRPTRYSLSNNISPKVISDGRVVSSNPDGYLTFEAMGRMTQAIFGKSENEVAQMPIIQKAYQDYLTQLKTDKKINRVMPSYDIVEGYIEEATDYRTRYEALANEHNTNAAEIENLKAAREEITKEIEKREATEAEAPVAELAENQDIKGTGAAEQNFSGKAQYQDLLYEGNVQPDREGDVRPMEVPKTDPYDRNVSEFVANTYGAEATPDSMASTIEELVQEGALGFDRKSNQSALNDAAKVIESSSPAVITRRITTNIANGKIKDGDIEQAMLLYSHYANKNGERAQAQAAELMVDLTTMAHMTGRNLQLFKLLRKLTPEGQVMTVKRTVEQNVESMIRSGKASKDSKVEINEQLLEDYKKAAAENARAVSAEQKAESEAKMQELQQAIMADAASQIQSTFKAKWDAWRYMAMLGNAKTQLRNVAGNIAFVPYKAMKDRIGAAFEIALPKEQRTKALTPDLKLLNWARQDSKTEAVHDALKYTGKLGDDAKSAKFSENVRVFDSNIMESARKMVEKVPQNADMFFKDRYYATSLAGFLRARGYNLNDIQNGKVSEAVMAEARGYAINEAMKATFNDCNAFSDAVSSIGRNNTDNPWGKVLNYAGESLLPFRRTPANILVRFAEYSPAGMVKGAWDMAHDVASGKLSAASAVDQIASGLTGTGALMLGYFLAKGIGGVKLTGNGSDEDEKRQGHQDYALEFSIGGQEYSYKIDWAAPANLPLFVGANLYEALASKDADTSISTFSRILQTAKGAVEPLLQLSCMSSLNDFVKGIRYAPEGEGIYTAVADIATGYFTQGIPALMRQASQAAQVNKQTTFANDPDPNIRELQKLGAQIPLVGSGFQTDKRNAWGETETTADPAMRAVNAFLNPGTLKKIDNSELEQEISRLNETQEQNVTPPDIPKKLNYTDASGVYHEGYRLTEEQYQKIAETQGQTAKTILDKLTGNADYKKLTDEQKAFTFQAVYQYAQEKGKQAAIPDYHSNAEAWIADMRDFDMRGFIAQGSKKALDNAIGNAIASVKNGWQVTEATKGNMEQAYDSFRNLSKGQQKRILDEVSSDTLKYIEARKAGATTKNYLDITRNVGNLGSNAKAADKYAAVAKTTGISDSAKDAMVKAYMTDYDPNAKSPNTIELKYDYAREELGLTAEEFAQVYRISAEDGKKDEKYEKWKNQGYSPAECDALWALFEASGKKKTDVVAWHNSK